MASPQTLTTDQKIPVGVTIFDKGKPPVPFQTVPDGWDVTFVSSDPAVVRVEERPDGLNADLFSDSVGMATITVSVVKPDGTHLAGSPDVTEVTVKNAEPGNANVTFGAPEPE
jgi:hypothetical protein